MITPHPPQNPVPVLVLTPSGFIRGTVHVPAMKNLRTFLNAQDDILKLTEAVIPGSLQAQPFLALQKNAVLLIVPQTGLEGMGSEPSARQKVQRIVTCLLSLGSIRGYIEIPDNLRTSDFLLHSPGFIEVRECHIGPNPYLDPKETTGEPLPLVLVNSKSMVGVTEEGPKAAEPPVKVMAHATAG